MRNRILAINPGSTSTKIAVFERKNQLFEITIKHTFEELNQFKNVVDQYDFRKKVIIDTLQQNQIELNTIQIVMGRGGLIHPVSSGIYKINDLMKQHLIEAERGEHASNLGALISDSLAKEMGLECAYIVDPVMVDELDDVARIAGHPLFERTSIFHALNQKAIARTYASEKGKKYEELDLVVAHMGGGISVGAHKHGRVVEVNQALSGEGPFSPERSGTLPMDQLVELCFSGKYTYEEVKKMILGKGGYVAYFGSNDAYAVEQAALAGDEKAGLIEAALSYQVAQAIASAAAALQTKPDAILITGGLAKGEPIVDKIRKYINWMTEEIKVYPGEDEMKALAMNALMLIDGEAEAKEYK
ncbi:MAG: butyrate kinase [Bacteroidales bacterium]|jgi:butyrate kinase|nr:butyrate kinase [Bacteroidales bacterium]